MNQTSLVDFITPGLILIGVLIYLFVRRGRKKKDVYGFQMPGWTVLADDQRLYDVETAFKHGTVASAVMQTGYVVSDWHSNFEHQTLPNCVTGFIQLSKYGTGLGLTKDLEPSVVMTQLNTKNYRYLWCQFSKEFENFIHINSGNLVLLESNADVKKIWSDLKEMENFRGTHSWQVILSKKELVILVDELWTQEEIDTFLKLGLKICSDVSLSITCSN